MFDCMIQTHKYTCITEIFLFHEIEMSFFRVTTTNRRCSGDLWTIISIYSHCECSKKMCTNKFVCLRGFMSENKQKLQSKTSQLLLSESFRELNVSKSFTAFRKRKYTLIFSPISNTHLILPSRKLKYSHRIVLIVLCVAASERNRKCKISTKSVKSNIYYRRYIHKKGDCLRYHNVCKITNTLYIQIFSNKTIGKMYSGKNRRKSNTQTNKEKSGNREKSYHFKWYMRKGSFELFCFVFQRSIKNVYIYTFCCVDGTFCSQINKKKRSSPK